MVYLNLDKHGIATTSVLNDRTGLDEIASQDIRGGTLTLGNNIDDVFKIGKDGLSVGDSVQTSAPFQIDYEGNLTATSATISGAITATSGEIGGWTIDTTSIYTGTEDHDGYTANAGDITLYSSGTDASIHAKNWYIDTSGNLTCQSATIAGSTISTPTITGIQSGSEIAIQGWQQDMAFSASDYRVVAWASGTITLLDGTTYSITGANTGNMSALTYIYLDIGTSTTALQTTTTASTAVGSGKILIAVAENVASGNLATFQVFGGKALGGLGKLITADDIVANTVTANEIAANTITASEITANTLTADEISTGLYNEINANMPSDENLVAYWNFDEGIGTTANDASGNGYTGTLTNMEDADWIAGVVGTGLNFDANPEYVDCGTALGTALGNGVTAISVSLWFKADTTTSNDGIFYMGDFAGSQGELSLTLPGGNTLSMRMDNNGFSENYAFTDTASWHHAVMVYNGTTGKLYLDSVEVISANYTSGLDLSGLKTIIGAYFSSSYCLDGKVDEVRIYEGEVTAREAYALYKNPAGNKGVTIPIGRLTAGTIYSKQINLAVAAGTGDSYIAAGKTDFTNDDSGFILGLDDSDSDLAKFYIGNTTDYLNWDGSSIKLLCSGANAITIDHGSDILLKEGGDINFTSVTAPTACTAALIETAGNVDAGTHKYKVTYVNDTGETTVGSSSNTVTADGTHKQVSLTSIPTSSASSVTARKLHRTKAGGSTYYYLATIYDNTTTTYTDNIADSSLTATSARSNTTFGKIKVNGGVIMTADTSNTLLGEEAMDSNTTGRFNVAIGTDALFSNTTGDGNIAIGYYALGGSSEINNVAIGYNALLEDPGSSNIAIGAYAGTYEEGSNAFYINNQDRDNTAGDKTKSLLYGVMAAAAADQKLTINGLLNQSVSKTPASAGATGTAGDICWDASYIYVCTATDTWKRTAIANW